MQDEKPVIRLSASMHAPVASELLVAIAAIQASLEKAPPNSEVQRVSLEYASSSRQFELAVVLDPNPNIPCAADPLVESATEALPAAAELEKLLPPHQD